MSTTIQARILIPATVAEPRGAQWAAHLAVPLVRAGQWLWRALEAQGERRASRELAALARRYEMSEPELGRRLREAAEVREFAYEHMEGDRGFAQDLLAAADRHEYAGASR
jgi:hypothetical protein